MGISFRSLGRTAAAVSVGTFAAALLAVGGAHVAGGHANRAGGIEVSVVTGVRSLSLSADVDQPLDDRWT